MPDSHIDKRLDQLESKVDHIAEAMQTFARLEERNTSLTNITARHEAWLSQHDRRLRACEVADSAQSIKLAGNSRLVWTLIAAAGAVVGSIITIGGKAVIAAVGG